MPLGLQERPDLRPDMQGVFSVFSVLSQQRQYNQAGVQPLPVSEITGYLTELGISGVERRERHIHMLLEMDSKYMTSYFKKREKAK